MPYERDLIAERDEKEKIQNSVVKWWRVNYIDRALMEQLELEEKRVKEEDESLKLALEITARLESEAAENGHEEFNATTGTFSGRYGKNVTLDDAGMNQVESILNQKNSDIQKIVSQYN